MPGLLYVPRFVLPDCHPERSVMIPGSSGRIPLRSPEASIPGGVVPGEVTGRGPRHASEPDRLGAKGCLNGR